VRSRISLKLSPSQLFLTALSFLQIDDITQSHTQLCERSLNSTTLGAQLEAPAAMQPEDESTAANDEQQHHNNAGRNRCVVADLECWLHFGLAQRNLVVDALALRLVDVAVDNQLERRIDVDALCEAIHARLESDRRTRAAEKVLRKLGELHQADLESLRYVVRDGDEWHFVAQLRLGQLEVEPLLANDVVGRLVERRVIERRHNGAERRQLERKLDNESIQTDALGRAERVAVDQHRHFGGVGRQREIQVRIAEHGNATRLVDDNVAHYDAARRRDDKRGVDGARAAVGGKVAARQRRLGGGERLFDPAQDFVIEKVALGVGDAQHAEAERLAALLVQHAHRADLVADVHVDGVGRHDSGSHFAVGAEARGRLELGVGAARVRGGRGVRETDAAAPAVERGGELGGVGRRLHARGGVVGEDVVVEAGAGEVGPNLLAAERENGGIDVGGDAECEEDLNDSFDIDGERFEALFDGETVGATEFASVACVNCLALGVAGALFERTHNAHSDGVNRFVDETHVAEEREHLGLALEHGEQRFVGRKRRLLAIERNAARARTQSRIALFATFSGRLFRQRRHQCDEFVDDASNVGIFTA
jgi:hypothetical protein